MKTSDELKEKLHRGILHYSFTFTQEELEFVEFVLQLYNVAEDTVPDFFERLTDRIKELLTKMNTDLQILISKGAEKKND